MNLFTLFVLFFLGFTVAYILFTTAIFYHLSSYSPPGEKTPRIVQTLFLAVSLLFWISALYFLFQMYHHAAT